MLINQQKVTIKYGGATIQPNDTKLPDMLRKKSEIGKTSISKRQVVTAVKMKAVKDLLREYFDVMDVPDDEDGLVAFIVTKFEAQKAHYEALEQRYVPNRKYPDKGKVQAAIQLATEVLSQKKDNIALIDRVLKLEDKLFDSKEDLQEVESFFKTQVQVFDAAAQMEEDLRNELDYLSHEPEANDALNKIRLIVVVQGGFSYKKIPELNGLMATVREGHDRLLASKREEVSDIITQCMGAVHQAANGDFKAKDLVAKAETFRPEYCNMGLPAAPGIERINVIMFGLKNTTLIPYILYVAKNVENQNELRKIYGILESYLMKRMIVHAPTKNYNNLFTSLILNGVLDAEALKERLNKGNDATTFVPSDDDLLNGFKTAKLVNLQTRGILYLLEAGIRSAKSSTALLGFNNYSLEHMMPKKWRNNWAACNSDELARQRDSVLLTFLYIFSYAILSDKE